MTAVFVLRHPQTTWNLAGRYQGRLDAPLSDAGRIQTQRFADALGSFQFDGVYSSPLSRARDLASLLSARTSSPLHIDARLTEIALGPWEGLYRHQIEKNFPELYHRWYSSPESVHFPGGESAHDVQIRGTSVMSMLMRRHPVGQVLVVTHSVVIQSTIAAVLGLSLARLHRIHVDNCSITTFCGDGNAPQLLSMNGLEMLYGDSVAAAQAIGCSTNRQGRPTA